MDVVCTTCRTTHLHLHPLAERGTSCVGGVISWIIVAETGNKENSAKKLFQFSKEHALVSFHMYLALIVSYLI